MTEQAPSQTKNLRKKLKKREQRILVRLKKAQQAQEKALERYHRAEEQLQKSMARVQLIEGRLTLVQQQIDDLNENPTVTSAETEIPAWAQFIPPSSTDEEKSGSIIEPSDFAREARAAAEATEENTRTAAARAAEISKVNEHTLKTTAMNAEAEAEVAEGMAHAAVDRSSTLLEETQGQNKLNLKDAPMEVYQPYSTQEAVNNESDITLKIPHVQTQEIE